MTSKERANRLVASLEKRVGFRTLGDLLYIQIVGKEQNGEASGGDCSLSEDEWTALRDLSVALHKVADAIERYKGK